MTELEVQKIFTEQLTGQSTHDGLTGAYYVISLGVLEKWAKPWTELKSWELLKNNAYAKSSLCLFLSIKPGTDFVMSETHLVDLLFIYRHWLAVMSYLDENYATIDSPRFKKIWRLPALLDLRDIVNERCREYESQFSERGIVCFRVREWLVADQVFNTLYLVILGEDLFTEFHQEINQALGILRKFQKELTPAQEDS